MVVYASNASSYPKHLAVYRLATWGDDELIEYLLAVAKDRCGSIMVRLKDAGDQEFSRVFPNCGELCSIGWPAIRRSEVSGTH